MRKVFNVTGNCRPDLHYMVDITEKLVQIKGMVDAGQYFTINRARQYGKTTTLRALEKFLSDGYDVISLDFQMLSHASFETEQRFAVAFSREVLRHRRSIPQKIEIQLKNYANNCAGETTLQALFFTLSEWCEISEKKIVLMIDEVDSATNNQIFLDFLAQMRGYYLNREVSPSFWSVILAGVYDVKNIRRKIRSEEDHKMNSPWNIAADFDVVMSFSESGIKGMLRKYEDDFHTGMDTDEIAGLLYDYTSGYPYLVSRICKLMDEKITGSPAFPDKKDAWTKDGFLAAVRILLQEENTLYESLDNKLIDFPDLKQMLKDLLLKGRMIEYVPGDVGIRMASMFGFITIKDGTAAVANRIFETRLYNGFLAEEARKMEISEIAAEEKNQFIVNGQLDMDLVIQKFVCHYTELFGDYNERFLEDNGRCIFLLYLKPIINGTGNYYIEARTRTKRRTDLIIDFRGKQYIVELKLWHGEEYNQRGEEQLADYLDAYHLKRGYMVSFNFNKKKQVGVNRIMFGEKVLIEAVV